MTMNKNLEKERNFVQQRGFRQYRTGLAPDLFFSMPRLQRDKEWRNTKLLRFMCELEDPIVFKDEKISFTRSRWNLPNVLPGRKWLIWQFGENKKFSPSKTAKLLFQKAKHKILLKLGKKNHICDEKYWAFSNTTPNYDLLLKEGLEGRIHVAETQLTSATEEEHSFLCAAIEAARAVIDLSERYAAAAERAGNLEVAKILHKVPRGPAETFHEALQSLRFVTASFVLAGYYQIGFGRMDQYLYPYYESDLKKGTLTRESAKELLAEFFIALNRDNDLCSIVQQGDNGLSLMLGGCKKDGTNGINDLTYMILETSRDLQLIDPKVNLRIDSNTPDDLLQLACELTKVGLGFPQYSNDEVIIPALVRHGYDLEDARDYTVAACWEFIIPGKECGVVNQGAVSFPAAVDRSLRQLVRKSNFSEAAFRKKIREDIESQIRRIKRYNHFVKEPAPFISLFYDGCLEKKQDVTRSAKYRNSGIHGAGSANGADQLRAILGIWQDEGMNGLKKLVSAANANFEDMEDYRRHLEFDFPKIGNDDDSVDKELTFLFDAFADAAEKFTRPHDRIRPGTGSAMYYIWLADPKLDGVLLEPVVKATSDGRRSGTPLGASLAPAQGVKVKGILSVFKSFSHIDYSKIYNGGPVTIELGHSVFNSPDGIEKLAQLVKYFVKLKNQQLQLNVLDAAVLEDAVKHPERHQNLIVRVWGWSGYFCELAPEYQQHIINRHKYGLQN